MPERTDDLIQALLDRLPQAKQYYSDAFPTYQALLYSPGKHKAMPNKTQTYSVDADNAELRHYLAHFTRKSCYFSRSMLVLWHSVKLFVFAWNPSHRTLNG